MNKKVDMSSREHNGFRVISFEYKHVIYLN